MSEAAEIVEVVSPAAVREVAGLAREIWNEHYPAIIGQEQVDYMLEKFQSETAVARQIREGTRYFLILEEQRPVGYFAFKPEPEQGRMFLSKLYVRRTHRRRGLAKRALERVEAECRTLGLSRVYLAVNRQNREAIAAYERLGFNRVGERVVDIGSGFVMDDLVMEKTVPSPTAGEKQ